MFWTFVSFKLGPNLVQVLRRNNGMVDQTIDDLLAISCVEEDQPRSSAGPSNLIDNQNQLLRPIQQAPASAWVDY